MSYLLFTSPALTPKAYAQTTTLSITPPVVEILLAPDKKLIQNFTFKAEGDNLLVIPEIHLAKPQGTRGHIQIDPNPYTPSDIPLTITSSHPLGKPTLLKNHELNISLTLESASVDIAQDIYLVLLLKIAPSNDLRSSSETLPGIGALIFTTINPSGVTPIDLSVEDFTPPLFHDSYLPLFISPTLKNNVPIMIRPSGFYEVLSSSGNTIFSLPLYPNLVLGKSSRSLESKIKDQPSSLTWSPSWKNIGPYRLRLTITTEGGTKIIETEKPIWILPIRGIILAFLIILIIIIVFIRSRRSLNQKWLDNDTE